MERAKEANASARDPKTVCAGECAGARRGERAAKMSSEHGERNQSATARQQQHKDARVGEEQGNTRGKRRDVTSPAAHGALQVQELLGLKTFCPAPREQGSPKLQTGLKQQLSLAPHLSLSSQTGAHTHTSTMLSVRFSRL